MKKTKKSFKNKHRKGTNYFFEEKEIKTRKKSRKQYKNLSEKEKQKKFNI